MNPTVQSSEGGLSRDTQYGRLVYTYNIHTSGLCRSRGTLRKRPIIFAIMRVYHDLCYTVSSTEGGTDYVTVLRPSHPHHRRVRFDEPDRGRVCSAGPLL